MGLVTASVVSTDQKMGFAGTVRDFPPLQLDYYRPYGDDTGPGPMEMILVALGTCTGSGVALLLRKLGRSVASVRATLTADRSDTHPTVFNRITIALEIASSDTTEQDLESCLAKAEATLCPVYVMLAKSVEIEVRPTLVRPPVPTT